MYQPNDLHWRENSLCAQTDAEFFFPAIGANATAARRICAACPVRADCLTDALNTRDVAFGVRGGMTPLQRRAMLKDKARRTA